MQASYKSDNLPDAVAAYLRCHCAGRANAQTKKRIAQALGIDMRELHDVVAALIERKRMPICSACREPMGYYLATAAGDRRETVHALRRRAIAIWRRATALKCSPLYPGVPKQGQLF